MARGRPATGHGRGGRRLLRPPAPGRCAWSGVTGTNGKTTVTQLVRADPRGRRLTHRGDRHPGRRRGPRRRHPTCSAAWPRSVTSGPAGGGHGGVLPRPDPAPGGRHRLRRGGLHQPQPGPPRPPRHRWRRTSRPRRRCSRPERCRHAGGLRRRPVGRAGCSSGSTRSHELTAVRRRRGRRRGRWPSGGRRFTLAGTHGRPAPDRSVQRRQRPGGGGGGRGARASTRTQVVAGLAAAAAGPRPDGGGGRAGAPVAVLVDYAHTPAGLEAALRGGPGTGRRRAGAVPVRLRRRP